MWLNRHTCWHYFIGPDRQRSSIITLTALLLPCIIFLLGIVVDIGNIYIHKAAAQNAADAAALGGAKVGWQIKQQTFSMADARAKSEQLIDDDMFATAQYTWQAKLSNSKKNPETTKYYIVTIDEDVPLYFCRYLLGEDTRHISAHANAKIIVQKGAPAFPLFSNLITYKDRLNVVNSKDKTWQGKIIHTDPNPAVSIQGDIVKGTERGLLHQIDDNGKETLLDPRQKDYYDKNLDVDLNASSNKDLKKYIDDLCQNTKGTPCSDQKLTSKDLQNDVTYIHDSDQNKCRVGSIDINAPIGTAGSTHVLIITAGAVNLNIDNIDTQGTLVIIDLSNEQLAISGGGKMHAIIYAPNSRIIWNPHELNFYGSIISKDVDIQSSTKSFTYEVPKLPATDGSGNSSIQVNLSSDEDDIA